MLFYALIGVSYNHGCPRSPMKILVIGGGGREHALIWRLNQSDSVRRVYCAPGNAGIATEASCIPAAISSKDELVALARTLQVDLTVVGPEAPLVSGIADAFQAAGLSIVAPDSFAAQLEGSKIFAKQFMAARNIPTAAFAIVESSQDLSAQLDRFQYPIAVKADGLAAGKGVVIVNTRAEAEQTAQQMLAGEFVSGAGRRLVLEEFLVGEELSFILLCDGKGHFIFPPTQDHKPAFDNDEGPNTGGMGAYCDPRLLTAELKDTILEHIVEPTLGGMRDLGHPFCGFLYVGLMITSDGPKVLEYNVRMGDPETQPLMHRLRGDFAGLLASAAHGSLDPNLVTWDAGPTACVVLASEGYPGSYPKGRAISGIAEAESAGAKVFHAGTLLSHGCFATSGGRVLGVTASGTTLSEALETTYAATKKIHFEGMHHRTDIGRKGLARYR